MTDVCEMKTMDFIRQAKSAGFSADRTKTCIRQGTDSGRFYIDQRKIDCGNLACQRLHSTNYHQLNKRKIIYDFSNTYYRAFKKRLKPV